MSIRIETMRAELMKLYDGPGWKARVSNWPTNQVYAVYMSCLQSERFEKRKEQIEIQRKENNGFYQYTIWDYMK